MVALVTGVLVACVLVACAGEPPVDDPHPASATILLASEPAGVNPLVSGGSRSTQDLIDRLFLHLFEEQPDFARRPPTFAPQLASAWRWSDDGLRLTIDLRQDVRWSDGVAVTADDVRWTWEVQRDPRVGWPYAEVKRHIVDVRPLGAHRLEVLFDAPSPNRLAELNEGNILPRHAWGRLALEDWPSQADWFARQLVTNGPFRLAAWQPQQELVLVANPDYHEPGLPGLERVIWRIVPLRRNRLAALERGEADFVAQLTPDEARRLAEVPHVSVRQFWHRQYDYVAWNTRRERLASAAVRRALTQAIDRQTLVDALWHGQARVATGPIPANVWAHHPGLEPWPHAPAAARATLEAEGWGAVSTTLEQDGERFSLELLVNAGNPIHVDAALLIGAQLQAVGIEASVRRLDFHALIDRLDSGDFDAAIGSWGIDTSLDLGYAFHSESWTEGYNSGGYANPRADALIEAHRVALDLETRRRILYELQEILHVDQPYTFLWEPPRLDAQNIRLGGVEPNPLSSLFRLRQWRLQTDVRAGL